MSLKAATSVAVLSRDDAAAFLAAVADIEQATLPDDLRDAAAELSRIASLVEREPEERWSAARARAEWELGSNSWAGVIVGAFLHPEEDADALAREMA